MPHPSLVQVDALVDWLPDLGRKPPMSHLVELYRHPGPFASIHLATDSQFPVDNEPMVHRWHRHRQALLDDGATNPMIEAADRIIHRRWPGSAAGICVLVAADGAAVADHDHLPPLREGARLGPLPSVGQLLEWHQRRIPTLVVAASNTEDVAVANFSTTGANRRYALQHAPGRMLPLLAKLAVGVDTQLIVVSGRGPMAEALTNGLPQRLPVDIRVVAEPDATSAQELVAATLRQIGIAAAGTTLSYLREQRFLAAVGAATDGPDATIAALRSGDADILLAHDHAGDTRTVWTGSLPRQLDQTPSDHCPTEVALVDGLLRSAIMQAIDVRMTPSLGPGGPVDDVAAIMLSKELVGAT
jgi:CO/xanthine dehydrogenase FAD-binding subunit